MKARLELIFLLFTLIAMDSIAQVKVYGRLLDNKDLPIEFANISLQSPDKFQGTVSDEQGNFEMQVLSGSYDLKIAVIGYDSYETQITVETNHMHLGDIRLSDSSIQIDEVVVKADRIVRKADRFVVNLANDPTVFGKTGQDMLNISPGVFIQDRDGTISINGKTGTKVYVNERPLHETGSDLVNYLRSLRAEDILRIEVVPTAGADYDADIHGGIIKITLKRQREDGIYGHVGISYHFAPDDDVYSVNPSFGINYRNNRFSLYSQFNYDEDRQIEHGTEEVITRSTGRTVDSNIDLSMLNRIERLRMGGIYDLSDKQSLGLEGYYSRNTRKNKSASDLVETTGVNRTDIISFYHGKNTIDNYSVSANYMLQLDSLGSMFKVLLDYAHNETDDNQHYYSEFSGYLNYDTIYRSNMLTENNLYALSTDFSIRINENSTVTTGLKYTHNKMDNRILFESEEGVIWNEIKAFSNENEFKENIAAVYGAFSSQIKKVNYSMGLRGEYTHATPWTNKSHDTENQKYFKLFPTVYVLFPFGRQDEHSVVVNYNRKIQRPKFSDLNPFRIPASEYLYIEGNPKLEAALLNDYSASLRLFNRYNFTVGITDSKGTFERVLLMDPDIPDVIIQRTENVGKRTNYYLAANTSLNPVGWWQVNMNLSAIRNEVKVREDKRIQHTFQGYIGNMFYLPKDFILDLSGFYMSPTIEGNAKIKMDPWVNTSLRREFFNKRLSVRLYANNLFDTGIIRLKTEEDDFYRNIRVRYSYREIGFGLRYNFRAGKSVQVKNVQTGAAEEKARLN